MPQPLTEDQIKALEHRVKENWHVHRGDMEALFMMARERNALLAGGATLPPPAAPVPTFGASHSFAPAGTGVPIP